MSNVARRRLVLGIFLAVLIGVLLAFASCGPIPGSTDTGVGTGTALADSSRSFTIGGNTTEPISPGITASLDLKLTNPHDVAMSVTGLRVRVQKLSAPNADPARPCGLGDFAVVQASSSRKITLAPRSARTLSGLGIPRASWPGVGMLNRSVNQDGCKGASLTLSYTGSGTLEK